MGEARAKVLVIDDEPINIRTLYRALDQDYEVLAATSGAEGLEVAARQRPDIVLLDVLMPGMDGYEVCRRLKADPQTADIPVLFVTAMTQVDDEANGLEAGAIDYITKPFHPGIVRLRVRNHLDLKRYRDMLTGLSFQDGLTGIPNRRCFDEHLATEWKRASRLGSVMSVIMVDIDHFKLFNDAKGHVAGDECLRQVANALRSVVQRPADLAARFGGEEFACILPDTEANGAEAIASAMRGEILSLAIPHPASPVLGTVTISVGVASGVPLPSTPPEALLQRADVALYSAKANGRNRVVMG
jgi:diguanylate cyclase (GGDEF)-like protein